MIPGVHNLLLYQGITFGPLIIQCRDANDSPVDLTSYKISGQVRDFGNNLKIDLAPTITNAGAGEITIKHSDEQTKTFPLGEFNWDLVIELSTGERLGPFLQGQCLVRRLNTQDT